MDLQIIPKKLSGAVTPPPSKSQAHRLLLCAALAQGVGMVQGAWAGDRTATRAEGAVMLHKLLSW